MNTNEDLNNVAAEETKDAFTDILLKTKRKYTKRAKTNDNSIFEFNEDTKEFPGFLYCKNCDYKTSKKHLLSKHELSHLTDYPFECDRCDKRFKLKVLLDNHKNKHLGIKKRRCTECDRCFGTSCELLRHIRYKHTLERPFRCMICTYSSVERAKLNRHIRSHTGERPYLCPHCSYASADMFKLKRHIRVHTGEKPYKCDVCSMSFSQQNSMKSHRALHFDRPVFQCELCPSTLTREADLRDHVRRIHTSTVPIVCNKCGKSFPDRYTIKIHLKTHQGEACFKCELCNYETSCAPTLQAHIFSHTGENPYKCMYCKDAFRLLYKLNHHLVNVHRVTVQKKPIHQCNHCQKLFVSLGCFKNHMKKAHPEILENDDNLEDSILTDISTPAAKVNKKRGRKPKNIKSLNEKRSMAIFSTIPAPRKRGRPRKSLQQYVDMVLENGETEHNVGDSLIPDNQLTDSEPFLNDSQTWDKLTKTGDNVNQWKSENRDQENDHFILESCQLPSIFINCDNLIQINTPPQIDDGSHDLYMQINSSPNLNDDNVTDESMLDQITHNNSTSSDGLIITKIMSNGQILDCTNDSTTSTTVTNGPKMDIDTVNEQIIGPISWGNGHLWRR